MNNLILNTDSYKLSMFNQYPEGTEVVHSHIMARKGGVYDKVFWFGFNAILDQIRTGICAGDIEEARAILAPHGEPFYEEGWQYIIDKYNGKLPVIIRAKPEMQWYDCGEVLASVENTDPKCFWLTTYLETQLLRVWYPSTVATISQRIRNYLEGVLERTGTVEELPFKLHDFGSRGVSSTESSVLGGMAHMTAFFGTDNVPALWGAKKWYPELEGYSIPAMEHSTVTSWGDKGEADAFKNMLEKYPTGLVACVSDSYDLYNAVDNIWGNELKDVVETRDGLVVIRPDSGDPVQNVLYCLESLDRSYGSTVNDKGFKVLNKVRVIQGDGIDETMVKGICEAVISRGYSIDNVAFGMGGALLQHCDRDWLRWAMKCSAIRVNGEWRDVQKKPKTDPSKASKAGRFIDMPVVYGIIE